MDAPKCKTCGERHWGTCAEAIADTRPERKEREAPRAARVRDPADVARIAALEAEVARLKAQITVTPKRNAATVTPERNASAERQRRYRERRKAKGAA